MHQYKVHLPKQSMWDRDCDYEEWLGHSYSNGVNRDQLKKELDDDDEIILPTSLTDIPLSINGSFNN